MAAASDGGSTVAECLSAASRIDIGDDASWYNEWARLGDANRQRAAAALRDGHVPTAASNLLRAISYYQAAAFPFDAADPRYCAAVASARECARKFLQHRTPLGEIVTIPWLRDHSLQGYFLPAGLGAGRAPTVICIGEPGQRKEEYLFRLAGHACARGLGLLAVDLLGKGYGERVDELTRRRDLESVLSHVTDYLVERDDVDEDRIAVLADGWESSFVARGIASDPRYAAAVCDGGIWDWHERAFLARRMSSLGTPAGHEATMRSIARNITCPLLITLGEHGWLAADRVSAIVDQLRSNRRDITLRVFEAEETGAAQGHADNPTLVNEFIFDWISSRLGAGARTSPAQKSRATFSRAF